MKFGVLQLLFQAACCQQSLFGRKKIAFTPEQGRQDGLGEQDTFGSINLLENLQAAAGELQP